MQFLDTIQGMLPFSPRTVREYLPAINSIYALLEVDIHRYPELENKEVLDVIGLEKSLGVSKLSYSMAIIDNWFQGTDFEVERHLSIRKHPTARWSDFIRIFDAKILEHQNTIPVIVLTVSKSGHVTRTLDQQVFEHDFEKDSQKVLLLQHLADQETKDYVSTDDIRHVIGAKTNAVVNKAVEAVRTALESKLKLPPNNPIIDSKRGSGYRIDPLYSIVLVD